MWVVGGRGVGIRLVWWDQGKHKDGLVYSMSNPLVEYTGWRQLGWGGGGGWWVEESIGCLSRRLLKT